MYKEGFGNIPNKDKVVSYLEEGYRKNPGKRVIHLWVIGHTAENIADELGLDTDVAFAIGALHDIGKSTSAKNAEHIINGYKILRSSSYFFPARIALTHSFQIKNVNSYVGKWNISPKEKEFVSDFLKKHDYTDYDLLIQLLDGMIKTKYLGIEKRAEKVKEKHGDNPYFEKRRERLYELKDYFENRLSKPILEYVPQPQKYKFPYTLLPKDK